MLRLENIYPIESDSTTDALSDMGDRKWAAIDVETGGLDCMRHALLSVAVYLPEEGTETIYIKPEGEIEEDALKINHIDLAYCAHGCSRGWAAKWLADKLHDRVIVGHSVGFDLGFLLWRIYRLPPSPESGVLLKFLRCVDTYKLARDLYPDQKHDLGTTAQTLGIEVDESRRHDAGYDAWLCGQVYTQMRRKAEGSNAESD